MQNGFLDVEEDTENSPIPLIKLSYEDALDSIRFFTTDIWSSEESPKDDGFTSAMCNICLKNELLEERFSSVTAADILADVSVDSIAAKTEDETKEEDYFGRDVFKLHQEFNELPFNVEKDHNTNQTESCLEGEERAVGYGRKEEKQPVTYNHPFDPRLTFAGLQDVAFPECRYLRADDTPQDNVCLAVDDVSDIVHEYLNKYHDFLTTLRSDPGNWVNQPDAVLPAKFASFDLWSADRNQVSVDKEVDPECRLLAAKVTSNNVKRLWSEGSCYTSSSDDQDLYSNQGSASDESISPRTSPTALSSRDDDNNFPDFPDAFSYPFFQSDSARLSPDEPISPLWSGRNVDSFQDFVPRMTYGFNLPVPEVAHEAESPSVENVPGRGEDKERETTSKLFNLWRAPDTDVGDGDGISSRCSEKSESRSASEKSSPEAGLQIPRLVSTKRRERPIRGIKNTRRTAQKDYRVTFVDSEEHPEKSRYPGQGKMFNSRAAISDTTVWSYSDVVGDKKRRSRSETHQESSQHSPRVDKVELSAKSEPFFPRGTDSGYHGSFSPTKGLNTIDEELSVKDPIKSNYRTSIEKHTSLSPVCEPFVPRSNRDHYTGQQVQNEEEDEEDEEEEEIGIDYLCRDMDMDDVPSGNISMGKYETWSPATDFADKDYKLFGERKYVLGDVFGHSAKSSLKPQPASSTKNDSSITSNKTLTDWYTPFAETVKSGKSKMWDIWKNTSDDTKKTTKWPNSTTTWPDSESTQIANTNHRISNPSPPLSTQWHSINHNMWSRTETGVQPQDLTKSSSYSSQKKLSLTSVQPVLEMQESRLLRPQTRSGHDLLSSGSQVEPRPRASNPSITSSRSSLEKSAVNTSCPEAGNRFLQGGAPVRTNSSVTFMTNPVACLPTQQPYDNSGPKMVVLHPHPKQPEVRPALTTPVFPHAYATPQHAPIKPAYQTQVAQGLHRVPLEHRFHPPVISRQNPSFPQTGFPPTIPAQTYRHVTVATNYNPPKLVAVPTFDAHPQPRFFAPFLNFNNHNEAYRSQTEVSDSVFDLIGCRDEEQERSDKRVRARPIRANPANLIHIT